MKFQPGHLFRLPSRSGFLPSILAGLCLGTAQLPAAEPETAATPAETHYHVTGYEVSGSSLLSTNVLNPLFAQYTGTNVTLKQILLAATDLHYEFCKIGQSDMSVAIARNRLTNGVITLNVFRTDIPQVVVSGESYLRFTNAPAGGPASAAEIAVARTALMQTMTELKQRDAELKAQQADTRVHVVSTNTGPRFAVNKYLVAGNTVLTPQNISQTLTNIDGAFGTNVSFDGISTAVSELQKAYRERGYVTVAVGVPPQKLTNAEVKLQVTEGRLAAISVTGNRYFSSNNVMRALPSLHTNMLIKGPVFQAELNRANANRDRQIYPVIGPGPTPGSSALTLKVKDQLPVHGKAEFNNESSPGTPDLRVNSSVVLANLWQREHSLGAQYGFSPENYKSGNQWNFYDKPQVANYSAFYRLPLGGQDPIENVIANNQDSFGYNEATRRFTLPPSTGRPELTMYASRSTIDTGVNTLLNEDLTPDIPKDVRSIYRQDVQQDITINDDVGFRLTKPMQEFIGIRSTFSGGADYKYYSLTDYKTNTFTFTEITRKPDGSLNPPIVSSVNTPVPVTINALNYLPVALHYDASTSGRLGFADLGLDMSVNSWYSGSKANLQNITGSTESSGHWVTLDPSLSWNMAVHTNWMLSIKANGQWASEPLISNEQFGAGGVNSVRGYHEGEVFGDTGWHISIEQQTPSHVVGTVYGDVPLTVRGAVYMDYAETFLLDPAPGSSRDVSLWGTGFGTTASLGSHWEARFLFSLPLLSAGTVNAYQPFFNFALTAQF